MSAATVANPPKSKSTRVHARPGLLLRRSGSTLDNSPHVPFFKPIIHELRARGYEVFVTARDAYQVRELTEYYGVEATVIGKHYGKHKILKALGTFWRTVGLTTLIRQQKPDLAICHGSRGMLLTSALLRIPCLVMVDYEFSTIMPIIKPTWFMVPSVVPQGSKGFGCQVLKYPGIKEDVYLSKFQPDQSLRSRLEIPEERRIDHSEAPRNRSALP